MYVSDEEWDGTVIAPVVGVTVSSVAVAAPAERTIEKETKRYDENKKWFDKTIKKGKKVGKKTKKGVWRTVPGFPKRTVRASSKGWLKQWSVKEKKWKRPKRGSVAKGYYLKVKVHGNGYAVSILVNRAFNGAPPSEEHSTDHIAKRDDGNKEKERQDNRACNLRWATRKEQSENQTRADNRALEVCSEWPRDDWTVGAWVRFQTQVKAAAAMGVNQASVSQWLYRVHKCIMGWCVRWAEDRGDCRLSNLRALTRSDNNRNQTRPPLGDGNQYSKKTRLRYRRADAPDDAPWETCLGAAELARRLTAATGENYDDSSIIKASKGAYKNKADRHKYKDCVFYKL